MIDDSWIEGTHFECVNELRAWLTHLERTQLATGIEPLMSPHAAPARRSSPSRLHVAAARPPSEHPAWISDAVATLPALCTVREAAAALRSSTRTVARRLASGELVGITARHSGSARVFIPRAEIARYLARLG